MRRPLIVLGVVVIVTVVAVPAVRHGVASRLEALRSCARARVVGFRQDFAAREAELRAALLPDPADVATAERRQAASRDSVAPY